MVVLAGAITSPRVNPGAHDRDGEGERRVGGVHARGGQVEQAEAHQRHAGQDDGRFTKRLARIGDSGDMAPTASANGSARSPADSGL